MADVLRLLAKVSHHQADSTTNDLEAIANKQETAPPPKPPAPKPSKLESQDTLKTYSPNQFLEILEHGANLNMDDSFVNLGGSSMGNYEIQDLMSQYNQSEQVSSDAEKKRDQAVKGLLQNVKG